MGATSRRQSAFDNGQIAASAARIGPAPRFHSFDARE
jgi:hypothetical protein